MDKIVNSDPRRSILKSVVAAICSEAGFESTDIVSMEILVEMMQSLLFELGRSTQAFCEISGRSEPTATDVYTAMLDLGLNLDKLPEYAHRPQPVTLPHPIQFAQIPKQPSILQTGLKRAHPSYISEYLPPFPDSYAYIRTPTHKQPVTEYDAIREKAANQKRDVERALTKFVAKTSVTESLFPKREDCGGFPLIKYHPSPQPYLLALLPQDQVFAEDDMSLYRPIKQSHKEDLRENVQQSIEINCDQDLIEPIDNPYLRPPRVPHNAGLPEK